MRAIYASEEAFGFLPRTPRIYGLSSMGARLLACACASLVITALFLAIANTRGNNTG